MSVVLPYVMLDDNFIAPRYAHPGDAGLDLRARADCVIKPFERVLVSCGIAIAIPEGYAGFVVPRSGLALNHGVSIVNAPGLIDSGYRGEIKVILVNLDPEHEFVIKAGDRIAQLVVMQTPRVELEHVADLPNSARGASGFGSSGVG